MILTISLPAIAPNMSAAIIESVHAAPGTLLTPGGKLFDLKVDLSLAAAHDCPPVSFHRIAVRNRVWLRQLLVAAGDEVRVGAPLAIVSSEPDEALDAPADAPAGAAKVSVVGILPQSSWW